MRVTSMTQLPPDVPGVLTAGPDMAGTMLRWSRAGYRYTVSRASSPRAARIVARCILAIWWPSWPLLYVVQRLLLRRRRARYYLSTDKTAILAVVASKGTWVIEDHLSCEPGGGHGKRLRDVLVPSLLADGDQRGVAVELATVIPELAALYSQAVPGLDDVGRAWPRGRKLRRESHPRQA